MSAKNFGSLMLLPAAKSFSSQLGEALGKGVGNIFETAGETYQKRKEQEQLDEAIERVRKSKTNKDIRNEFDLEEETPSRDYAEEQRLLIKGGRKEEAKIVADEAKLAARSGEIKKKEHYKAVEPIFKRASELATSLPYKKLALDEMKQAIEEGNLSFFSADNLAEITGIEGFRSSSGAKFKTAAKEFFLSNTSRVGAKGLNQWFEKQIATMQPQIGRSQQANLEVAELLAMENDVSEKEIELTNQIANAMEEKYGYTKRDLGIKLNKSLSSYAKARQEEAKRNIESIKERYTPVNKKGILMKDPGGNTRRVPMDKIKEAQKAGYQKVK